MSRLLSVADSMLLTTVWATEDPAQHAAVARKSIT